VQSPFFTLPARTSKRPMLAGTPVCHRLLRLGRTRSRRRYFRLFLDLLAKEPVAPTAAYKYGADP